MTTASQAPLKLPPSFATSFWASHPAYPSYRSAITHLYSLLQHGLDENVSLLAYVRSLVDVQWELAESLRHTSDKVANAILKEKPIFRGARDEDAAGGNPSDPSHLGSTSRRHLLVHALQTAAVEPLAATHVRVTQQLTRSVLEPFGEWSGMHAERVKDSWTVIEEWLDAFERGQDELDKLRHSYETKCRQADEAEDDARFSGIDVNEEWERTPEQPQQQTQTQSQQQTQTQSQQQTQLPSSTSSGSIIDHDKESTETAAPSAADDSQLDPVKLERRQTLRKQFGFSPRVTSGGSAEFSQPQQRAVSGSSDSAPSPESSSALKRSGTISSALTSALSAPAVQAIKERLAAAAGTGGIAEKWKRLRREADKLESEYLNRARSVDTLRCRLEDAISEQLSALQRYEVDRLAAVKTVIQAYSTAFNTLNPTLASRLQPLLKSQEPSVLIAKLIASARTGFYRPQTEVFHPFYHDEWNTGSSPAVGYGTGWAGFGMHLNARWRAEVLAKHTDATRDVGMLDAAVNDANNKPKVAVALPLALSHLLSSLERAYGDAAHWPAGQDDSVSATLKTANAEKRKSWIYEVPLKAAHTCRAAIISHMLTSSHPGAELGAGLPAVLDKFDAPTKAMTVKIWLAELQEGLVPEENWHLISSLYKAAESVEGKWRAEKQEKREGKAKEGGAGGSEATADAATTTPAPAPLPALELDDEIRATIRQGVLEDLAVVLGKLSSPHLVVLDSVISHLKHLISSTSDAGESDETYTNKLALSIGRFILRPPQVTHSSISSPIPVLLLMDLITYYDELIPPAISRKSKLEEEAQVAKRKMPTRKRTKPVDVRIRRSQGGGGGGGVGATNAGDVPPVPTLPPKIVTDNVGGTGVAVQSASPVVDVGDVDTSSTPTPIAERMFKSDATSSSTAVSDAAPTAIPSALSSATLAAPSSSASDAGGSSGGSAYGTPPADESDSKRLGGGGGTERGDEGDDTIGHIRQSTAATATPRTPSSPTKSDTSSPAYDEDKPLSNVARLSRQFGSASSGKSGSGGGAGGISRSGSSGTTGSVSGVRGPRPAGARASSQGTQGGVAALASRLQQGKE